MSDFEERKKRAESRPPPAGEANPRQDQHLGAGVDQSAMPTRSATNLQSYHQQGINPQTTPFTGANNTPLGQNRLAVDETGLRTAPDAPSSVPSNTSSLPVGDDSEAFQQRARERGREERRLQALKVADLLKGPPQQKKVEQVGYPFHNNSYQGVWKKPPTPPPPPGSPPHSSEGSFEPLPADSPREAEAESEAGSADAVIMSPGVLIKMPAGKGKGKAVPEEPPLVDAPAADKSKIVVASQYLFQHDLERAGMLDERDITGRLQGIGVIEGARRGLRM